MQSKPFIFIFCVVILAFMSGCSGERALSSDEVAYSNHYPVAKAQCDNHGQIYIDHYQAIVTGTDGTAKRWQVICYSENPVMHHTHLLN